MKIIKSTEEADRRDEFHVRYQPYARAIYRNALVVTGSTKSATRLQVCIYLRALDRYVAGSRPVDFESWLEELVAEFVGHQSRKLLKRVA